MNRKKINRILFIVSVFVAFGIGIFCLLEDVILDAKKAKIEDFAPPVLEESSDVIDQFKNIDFQELTKELTKSINYNGNDSKTEELVLPDKQTSTCDSEDIVALPTEKGSFVDITAEGTYILSINNTDTKVKLIGVGSFNAEMVEKVKERIKEGDTLYLEYDEQKMDAEGNTLAYLFFSNGTMIQDWLLRNGYAKTETKKPNIKYSAQLQKAEGEFY